VSSFETALGYEAIHQITLHLIRLVRLISSSVPADINDLKIYYAKNPIKTSTLHDSAGSRADREFIRAVAHCLCDYPQSEVFALRTRARWSSTPLQSVRLTG